MSIVEPPIEPSVRKPVDTPSRLGRNRRTHAWYTAIIVLLLLLMGAEAFIILEQKRVNQRIEAQSEASLGQFLKQGTTPSSTAATNILFRNVRFCWSPKVCINTHELTATAFPLDRSRTLMFDNLKSFIVDVHNAAVLISPETLQGMFNESVFNYPGSNLRNLTVGIEPVNGENHIKLTGSLKYFLWIPFEMDTRLSVDRAHNVLVITVNSLKVFGFIPTTWLIKIKPFNLDKLLTLPPNQHLTVSHNLMMVKPFGLFPPPRISGVMSGISVTPKLIQLQFAGTDPGFSRIPQPGRGNYIYLQDGNAQFGHIRMLNTRVQVIDRDPSTWFQFSLLNYLSYLPKSQVALLDNGSAVLNMPDHQTIPTMDSSIDARVAAAQSDEERRDAAQTQPPGFWQGLKWRVKKWFGI